MTPETQSLIDQLRNRMVGMTPVERGDIFEEFRDGYKIVTGQSGKLEMVPDFSSDDRP